MRPTLFLLTLFIALLHLATCSPEPATAPELHAQYCGSCHTPSAPASLPKNVWATSVLPEMAARMGIVTMGYNPASKIGEAEYQLARDHGIYPEVPTMSYDEWVKLRDYIIDNAPDSISLPPHPELRSLAGFTPATIDTDHKPGSLTTFIGQQDSALIIGDGYGQVTGYHNQAQNNITAARAPVVHYQSRPTGDLLLDIGNIYPTEASNGTLCRITDRGRDTIAKNLHRPVYFLTTDLDKDGTDEIVVCEYGHYTGALSLLKQEASGDYAYSRLTGSPGSIKVVAEDLNKDGRQDLIYLHAQGDEGIDVLYQNESGGFDRNTLLSFPSVWGTSWFELVDMDRDGDLDLLTVHGDNADYSNILKPYHGLRIWTNDGAGSFTQSYFQALPGATRIVARDFDADGDTDVAVACNFADFAGWPAASFVYFDNLVERTLTFDLQTTPAATDGRWLIMEAADYDQDGDDDLVLGSFTLNPAPVPTELAKKWREGTTDVLLLRNDR